MLKGPADPAQVHQQVRANTGIASERAFDEIMMAAGWRRGEPVTRCEVQLRREAVRMLRLPNVPDAYVLYVLDDPWIMLDYLPTLFAMVVGQAESACPDDVNVTWLRLVVPEAGETNHARWETAPTWRMIQAASFTPAPALVQARRLIRRTEHVRCAEQLNGILYGLLVRRVAELHPEGEHWDVSRALGDAAPALASLQHSRTRTLGTGCGRGARSWASP